MPSRAGGKIESLIDRDWPRAIFSNRFERMTRALRYLNRGEHAYLILVGSLSMNCWWWEVLIEHCLI